MSTSTLMTDYVGRGTFANRPPAPPIPANGTAFYFATDTIVLYMWTGAAWVIAGSGTGGGGGGGGAVYDWNQLDGYAGTVVVHGNGKSITGSYTSVRGAMRGFNPKSAGKLYFEFLVNRVDAGGSPDIGIGTAAAPLSDYIGGGALTWGMFMNGNSAHSGAFLGQNPYVAGDIVGIAVDFTAATGSIKFFKNNVAQTNSYTGLTLGTMYPMVSIEATLSDNPSGTLNLRAADQTYAPPAGYSSWL
jgi:hypothetical protein